MIFKFILNIFYSISIILLVLSSIWSFNHQRIDLLIASLFLLVMMVILKIRLAKQVRELTRERTKN